MAEAAQEQREIDARGVIWGGAAIVIGIVLAVVAAYWLWRAWGAPSGEQANGGPNTGSVPTVTAPGLQSAPQPERAQFFAEKQRELESWGWVDQRAGIAHIPIEDAMRIMASPQNAARENK
jgi:hypothetical protein